MPWTKADVKNANEVALAMGAGLYYSSVILNEFGRVKQKFEFTHRYLHKLDNSAAVRPIMWFRNELAAHDFKIIIAYALLPQLLFSEGVDKQAPRLTSALMNFEERVKLSQANKELFDSDLYKLFNDMVFELCQFVAHYKDHLILPINYERPLFMNNQLAYTSLTNIVNALDQSYRQTCNLNTSITPEKLFQRDIQELALNGLSIVEPIEQFSKMLAEVAPKGIAQNICRAYVDSLVYAPDGSNLLASMRSINLEMREKLWQLHSCPYAIAFLGRAIFQSEVVVGKLINNLDAAQDLALFEAMFTNKVEPQEIKQLVSELNALPDQLSPQSIMHFEPFIIGGQALEQAQREFLSSNGNNHQAEQRLATFMNRAQEGLVLSSKLLYELAEVNNIQIMPQPAAAPTAEELSFFESVKSSMMPQVMDALNGHQP